MQLEVGTIIQGKVTTLTKFGAFVALSSGESGLVHISEVADSYVNDVSDHLSVGQQVSVKIINITQDGKINLSIKKAEAKEIQKRPQMAQRPARVQRKPGYDGGPDCTAAPPSFEDKLKRFMQDSDSRMSGSKLYSQQKRVSRRKKD